MTPEFHAGERCHDVAITCTGCGAPCGADFEWDDGSGYHCFDCEAKDQATAVVIYPHVGKGEYLVVKVSYGYLAMVRCEAKPRLSLKASTLGKSCDDLAQAKEYLFDMGMVLG